ncbi:MAG: GNAT family N-acetyltransferase [Pseudomonadota bacterium]
MLQRSLIFGLIEQQIVETDWFGVGKIVSVIMYSKSNLLDIIQLRPVELDDIASVRYVHKTAFEILAGDKHSEDEVKAHIDMIVSQAYIEKILSCNMYCALIDDEIVGTAGWCPADDNGRTARIKKVFVRPLFHTMGIGKILVKNAEKRAVQAGFDHFSVQSNINAVPFYKCLNYKISSHGIMTTPMDVDLPVAFMRKQVQPAQTIFSRRLSAFSEENRMCA